MHETLLCLKFFEDIVAKQKIIVDQVRERGSWECPQMKLAEQIVHPRLLR